MQSNRWRYITYMDLQGGLCKTICWVTSTELKQKASLRWGFRWLQGANLISYKDLNFLGSLSWEGEYPVNNFSEITIITFFPCNDVPFMQGLFWELLRVASEDMMPIIISCSIICWVNIGRQQWSERKYCFSMHNLKLFLAWSQVSSHGGLPIDLNCKLVFESLNLNNWFPYPFTDCSLN